MPRPPFDTHFDRHVWPLLKERAVVNGTHVALGNMLFADALADLDHLARQRGSGSLENPAAVHARFPGMLLEEIDRADKIAARIAALKTREPSRFWRYIWGIRQ